MRLTLGGFLGGWGVPFIKREESGLFSSWPLLIRVGQSARLPVPLGVSLAAA